MALDGVHPAASAERLLSRSADEAGSQRLGSRSADLDQGATAPRVSELADDSHLEFLKAFVRRLVPEQDAILLQTDSDVPAGSGLGGSGALGVAMVAALDRAYGRSSSPRQIGALANEIERRDLGYPGGDDFHGAGFG